MTVFKKPVMVLFSWIQSASSHTILSMSILVLTSNLCLGLPSALFPWGFSTKDLYEYLFLAHACHSSLFLWFDKWRVANHESCNYVILSIMLSLFLKYMVHASLSGLCSEHFQCFIFWFVQFEDNFEWTCSTTALQYNGKCSGGGGRGTG